MAKWDKLLARIGSLSKDLRKIYVKMVKQIVESEAKNNEDAE